MAKSKTLLAKIERQATELMKESGASGVIEKDYRGKFPSITVRLRPGDGIEVREFPK